MTSDNSTNDRERWEWTQFYARTLPISVNIAHEAARNIRSVDTETSQEVIDE